jgi:hypothetical protein
MTLSNGQVEYNGYILGDDVSTFMYELTGWDDLPPITSGNSSRTSYPGSYPGSKLAGERTISWVGRFNPYPVSGWSTELKALRAAMTPVDEEISITIRTLDETLVAFGSVTNRAIPGNRNYGAAKAADVAIQFTCSDPRRYTETTNVTLIPFPSMSSAGLVYPLEYPLDYGPLEDTGSAAVANIGDTDVPVVYSIYGPVTDPVIRVGASFVRFDITLAAGEVLEVDTKAGTVVLNGVANRLYSRSSLSSPIKDLELPSGSNEVSVTAAAYTEASYVKVTARSGAYL